MLWGPGGRGNVIAAAVEHITYRRRNPMSHPARPAASRRDVLKFGVASLAAVSVGLSPLSALADEHDDAYGGIPMGIQSYSLRAMSLENALKALHNDLKLHEIELYPR